MNIDEYIKAGWQIGRKNDWSTPFIPRRVKVVKVVKPPKIQKVRSQKINPPCPVCGSSTPTGTYRARIFCSDKCKSIARSNLPLEKKLDGKEQLLIKAYLEYKSLNKALKSMGFPGAMGGWYKQAMVILKEAKLK